MIIDPMKNYMFIYIFYIVGSITTQQFIGGCITTPYIVGLITTQRFIRGCITTLLSIRASTITLQYVDSSTLLYTDGLYFSSLFISLIILILPFPTR
jgi:hypothetical protein